MYKWNKTFQTEKSDVGLKKMAAETDISEYQLRLATLFVFLAPIIRKDVWMNYNPEWI